MIHNRTPEPRLEPDHRFEDYDDDEFGADFIQPPEEELDDSFINYEEGEIRDLLRREP